MRRACAAVPWRLARMFRVLAFSALAGNVLASNVAAPVDDVEVVCHTDNPADCYPKIFQPTKEFQKIHEDQDLPPGLHIRLNIGTGEREAKLNDPDEDDAAVAGLPTNRAVVVVDPDIAPDTPLLPPGTPLYEPVGLVKPPGQESPAFHDALAVLKRGVPRASLFSFGKVNTSRFDQALEHLNEFAHDLYYGVKIAEDEGALRTLLCHMSPGNISDVETDEAATIARAQRAAGTVAAALQNNPTALRLVEKSWEKLTVTPCPSTASAVSLGERVFGSFIARGAGGHDGTAVLPKARLSALNGLLKSDAIKMDFLSRDGMTRILELLLSKRPEHEAAQRKAANLVMDNFLDEEMGANTGLWPRGDVRTRSDCLSSEQPAVTENCWDAHMETLAKQHRGDSAHWSIALWSLLKERRSAEDGTSRGKDEL